MGPVHSPEYQNMQARLRQARLDAGRNRRWNDTGRARRERGCCRRGQPLSGALGSRLPFARVKSARAALPDAPISAGATEFTAARPDPRRADLMKKATPKNLRLHCESLRSITAPESGAVAGGITAASLCATLCCDPSRFC